MLGTTEGHLGEGEHDTRAGVTRNDCTVQDGDRGFWVFFVSLPQVPLLQNDLRLGTDLAGRDNVATQLALYVPRIDTFDLDRRSAAGKQNQQSDPWYQHCTGPRALEEFTFDHAVTRPLAARSRNLDRVGQRSLCVQENIPEWHAYRLANGTRL